jgi:nucleoside-diphosphate-sugar epimerase
MQLVVGAGTVGATTAALLAESGEQVRLVTRSGTGPDHPNVELLAADATDAQALARLARGATVLYNCANPAYHRWLTHWPPLAAAILAAAQSAGAALVMAGNLYVYGPVRRPMAEDLPLAATLPKAQVRIRMWTDALAAYGAGRLRGVTEIRASDFIGPRHSLIESALPAMRAGRPVRVPMPLDYPHTFTYTGDFARALIAIGGDDRAYGQAWHVPSPDPMTPRQLALRVARVAGLPAPTFARIPEPLIWAAGLVDPFAREFRKVSYQFKRPFVLDARHTAATFGLAPTDVDEAIRATIAATDGVDQPGPCPADPAPR